MFICFHFVVETDYVHSVPDPSSDNGTNTCFGK